MVLFCFIFSLAGFGGLIMAVIFFVIGQTRACSNSAFRVAIYNKAPSKLAGAPDIFKLIDYIPGYIAIQTIQKAKYYKTIRIHSNP